MNLSKTTFDKRLRAANIDINCAQVPLGFTCLGKSASCLPCARDAAANVLTFFLARSTFIASERHSLFFLLVLPFLLPSLLGPWTARKKIPVFFFCRPVFCKAGQGKPPADAQGTALTRRSWPRSPRRLSISIKLTVISKVLR